MKLSILSSSVLVMCATLAACSSTGGGKSGTNIAREALPANDG